MAENFQPSLTSPHGNPSPALHVLRARSNAFVLIDQCFDGSGLNRNYRQIPTVLLVVSP